VEEALDETPAPLAAGRSHVRNIGLSGAVAKRRPESLVLSTIMAGLGPAIHEFACYSRHLS
jgi:hypothetical protein